MEDIELPSQKPKPAAITIRNAYKRYSGSKIVLNGFNLTVPEGSIYGLLGASGCGKTTVLSCLVGRSQLDAGTIKLSVSRRSQTGYMPQALSLNTSMTVYENFYFYGYLYGMSEERICARADELISFLQIPSGNRMVQSMSGGQQRRVSIAVTLFHNPKILIMDEPTVGLDPILSQSIWDHLLSLAANGKAVIITTHYIQEAQQAHVIGLMREGVLLAEESPISLMQKHSCDGLEEAFLKLSQQQEINISKSRNARSHSEYPTSRKPSIQKFVDEQKIISVKRFKGMMYKNTTLMKRELLFLVFVVFLPMVQVVLFNTAVGKKPKDIKIAVVNKESSCVHPNYSGCFLDENSTVTLSCSYLDYLINKTYNLKYYNDSKEAMKEVKKNKVWALLHFEEDFTLAYARRINDGLYPSPTDIVHSFINTWIDFSDQYIGSFIKYDVTRSLRPFLEKAYNKCELNPNLGGTGLKFETPIYGSEDEVFITYASAALVCLCSFFFPSLATALYTYSEKTTGMIERMLAAGASMVEILASILSLQMIIFMLQTVFTMVIMYCVFENPLRGNVITFIFLQVFIGTCGMLSGLTMAVMSNDLMLMANLVSSFNIILCICTGLLWPVEGAHELIKIFNWFLPIAEAVNAARGISLKSYDFDHAVLIKGFAAIVGWNFIFIFVVYLYLKIKKDAFSSSVAAVH